MNVTLISDASLYHQSRTAGWAGWAKSDRGQTQGSGVLKGKFNSTLATEFLAAANTLAIAIRDGVIAKGDVVLFQIDNLGVFKLVQGKHRPLPHWQDHDLIDKAYQYIRYQQASLGLKFRLRHIKAHSGTSTPRTAVHDWCDQASRHRAKTQHLSVAR